jgi:uncharacterized membrane protein YhaH (DUF805 family)
MVEGSIDESEAKQSGRWQRVLVFAGVPLIFLSAILAARIVWEETWLTLQQGPQMIGFSLAHGSAAVLLFAPTLLALWFVLAFLTMAVTLWRRKGLSIWFRSCLGTAVVVFGVLAFPSMCRQWMFINSFAKSPHAADLMTYAAREGDVRTVCGYLMHNVPVDATNYEGSTAAFTAAAGGSVLVLELLASKGANLSALNSYGDSPLEAATENHHDAAVSFLKSKGAVQVKGTPEQRDAASHAIVRRDIERMQHLH